jgi:hypothetical protein
MNVGFFFDFLIRPTFQRVSPSFESGRKGSQFVSSTKRWGNFFGCLANRLSRVEHLPLKAAAKVVHLILHQQEISAFFGLFFEEKG